MNEGVPPSLPSGVGLYGTPVGRCCAPRLAACTYYPSRKSQFTHAQQLMVSASHRFHHTLLQLLLLMSSFLPATRPIVLFDGVCNFCNGTVQFVLQHDKLGNVQFASLQSDAGQSLLQHFGLPLHHFDSFVVVHHNAYYTQTDAVVQLLKNMGGYWTPLGRVLAIVPRFIRNAVYNLIANNRYRIWGKKETCMLPTPAQRSRFIG
jgi:predicted DCC family thiol-disulfide oxidoreductase YuxK